eukprot:CAMPEP_0117435282 /NCGR_PEP_ID=MMETSP0759-20121206/399_1 /TAXON_ID=63605 /ORGANISM="Percolomonas cosmopolitus, Strain WS" /LENGTH=217 /DNA_ID=CAMNT_0005226821 /DNA_START=207 /DNA_END=860 /DNA_ORIENTATION=+
MCSLCVQLMSQTINQLINVIINVGLIGSCNKLCSYLQPYGQLAVVACNLICDGVGIEEFIKILEKQDIDVIYACELVHACPVHDCPLTPCGSFGPGNVSPQTARKAHENDFAFSTTFDILDQTGVGEIIFEVITAPGSMPPVLEGGELVPDGFQKGTYNLNYNIKLQDHEDAQPFPIFFRPGMYKIENVVCQAECGSKHPHSKILAIQKGINFTLTQ